MGWSAFKLQFEFQSSIRNIFLKFLRFNCEMLSLIRFRNVGF